MHWALEEILEEANLRVREVLAKHVGAEVLELVSKHPAPAELLRSSDARIRLAVLAQALDSQEMTQELADECEAMSRADTDSQVRGVALTCLSTFYRKKNNRRICTLLAAVVRDTTEREGVRCAAYSGLADMLEERDLSHSPFAPGFSFPADIDWAWVESFRL
jgi:hypothetical protein